MLQTNLEKLWYWVSAPPWKMHQVVCFVGGRGSLTFLWHYSSLSYCANCKPALKYWIVVHCIVSVKRDYMHTLESEALKNAHPNVLYFWWSKFSLKDTCFVYTALCSAQNVQVVFSAQNCEHFCSAHICCTNLCIYLQKESCAHICCFQKCAHICSEQNCAHVYSEQKCGHVCNEQKMWTCLQRTKMCTSSQSKNYAHVRRVENCTCICSEQKCAHVCRLENCACICSEKNVHMSAD